MREGPTRVGVLDVGCFSAHLLVVDAAEGSLTRPAWSRKVRLRLDKALDSTGEISPAGIDSIVAAVREATRRVSPGDLSAFVPFATSSVRDAANADDVLRRVSRRAGIDLRLFSGRQEAELSYLAARRWFGWSAGPLSVLDVGGGTVELAAGDSDGASLAVSLPLGARTLMMLGLDERERLGDMREEVRSRVADALPKRDVKALASGRAVGCSKVFQQLAHLAGAAAPDGRRVLRAGDLDKWIPRLAALSARGRAKLPGISRHRAEQSLAGALVAEALMRATGHDTVDISPWSTKEGLLLTLLERDRPATGGIVSAA
ncbi:Ppx/GppA phosphatase family protein [Actinokineospora iranica]|uniref:Exopolyphosphatase / guanosine-5'-triphosphate,3'-diphosphate pyrophosphatase n=1 Tax=Actinokineospora iranica TaxID=1271860 RepID=A0A1G6XF16_9PSEU|nr:exopolyphosphatase [Actinokineospora iranica]SDD76662.1 exopolyphosphatase / guanosine-5'-triphosphate,3'-diphosphate pyrophosphatase [Actinokineospora iranica]